ncbi:hypothetical protein Tco_1093370 [Tanacetum coccineum]|uniref:Uncharacterized protein n=1 Tax=Tanacetum coccineum TaxID=301880 RepID=A0ABQ5IEY3_9ASTR
MDVSVLCRRVSTGCLTRIEDDIEEPGEHYTLGGGLGAGGDYCRSLVEGWSNGVSDLGDDTQLFKGHLSEDSVYDVLGLQSLACGSGDMVREESVRMVLGCDGGVPEVSQVGPLRKSEIYLIEVRGVSRTRTRPVGAQFDEFDLPLDAESYQREGVVRMDDRSGRGWMRCVGNVDTKSRWDDKRGCRRRIGVRGEGGRDGVGVV